MVIDDSTYTVVVAKQTRVARGVTLHRVSGTCGRSACAGVVRQGLVSRQQLMTVSAGGDARLKRAQPATRLELCLSYASGKLRSWAARAKLEP